MLEVKRACCKLHMEKGKWNKLVMVMLLTDSAVCEQTEATRGREEYMREHLGVE